VDERKLKEPRAEGLLQEMYSGLRTEIHAMPAVTVIKNTV
jgi:hypothetical protein